MKYWFETEQLEKKECIHCTCHHETDSEIEIELKLDEKTGALNRRMMPDAKSNYFNEKCIKHQAILL